MLVIDKNASERVGRPERQQKYRTTEGRTAKGQMHRKENIELSSCYSKAGDEPNFYHLDQSSKESLLKPQSCDK